MDQERELTLRAPRPPLPQVPTPPAGPAGIVRRNVWQQLSGDEPLVVIQADRFSSASVLLRSWLATTSPSGTAVAHVIAPDPDMTEDEYWSCLDTMLRGTLTRTPPADGGAQAAFASLIDALSEQVKPCVLVLDDLHLIDDAASRVNDLLRNAPPTGVRIIATTRVDGEWPGRNSLAADQKIIHSGALNFDPDDIATLLRQPGLEYDVRTPEIITRLTGGLPTLVHAVCSTAPVSELRQPEHLAAYISPAIDHEIDRTIRGDRELTAHRHALLLSAATDPLTSGAAALLAEDDVDPAAFLKVLDRSGMTRTSGGPHAPERRFPEAVRYSLLRLAAAEIPEELHDHRMGLVRLWLHLDLPGDALKVAGDAEYWPLAINIIRENLETLYTRDYPTTMDHQVLARVPEHLVAEDPVLSRMRAVHHQFAAPRDTPGPLQENDGDAGIDDSDRSSQLEFLLRVIELRVNGRFEESAAMCGPAIRKPLTDAAELSAEDRDAEGFAYVHIGISLLMVGRFAEAITVLRRAFRIPVEPFIRRDAAGKLALAYVLLDDRKEAESWLDEERRYPALPASTETLVRPAGDVAAALLALDRVDPVDALDILRNLGSPADREEFWGFVLYSWAQLSLLNGTAGKGLRFIEKEMLRFTTMRDNGAVVGTLLDAARADLHLACGRPAMAASLVAGSSHPLTAPVRSRILLLDDDPRAAVELARTAILDLRTTTRDAMELELVAAAAALATGDRTQARGHLASAVFTSRMTGLLRPFRSLPDQVMRRLAALGPELPLAVGTVGREFGRLTFADVDSGPPASGDDSSDNSRSACAEPLSERELAVLRALATGATIRQIAVLNYVSVNTVKSQLRAVYRKLAVRSRDDAVAVALRLELI